MFDTFLLSTISIAGLFYIFYSVDLLRTAARWCENNKNYAKLPAEFKSCEIVDKSFKVKTFIFNIVFNCTIANIVTGITLYIFFNQITPCDSTVAILVLLLALVHVSISSTKIQIEEEISIMKKSMSVFDLRNICQTLHRHQSQS